MSGPVAGASPPPAGDDRASDRRLSWGVFGAFAVVVAVYVWIVSAGTWTRWHSYSAYHQKLADAFRHGQLHLLEIPHPRLRELVDPYDPQQNRGYRLHDASLYDGRYYLYWGPVPAVLVAAANAVFRVRYVPDQLPALAFAAGGMAVAAMLLLHLWRRHFRDAPGWSVPLAVLVVGLAAPTPFMLGRAAVYEVAITASQMFLLGGLYAAVRGAESDGARRVGILLLGGVALACAVGSRVSTAGPALVIAGMTAWHVWRDGTSERGRRLVATLALAAPLVAAFAGWAAYNQARFGSPLEFGVRYQLAAFNSHAQADRLASAGNVAPNLYSYLLRSPVVSKAFPYFIPRPGTADNAFPRWLRTPAFYLDEEATVGLLVVTPFAWFAAVAIATLVARVAVRRKRAPSRGEGRVAWLVLTLTLCAGAAALPAMVIALASVRYQADWTTFAMILAVIGFWTGHRWAATRPGWRRAWPRVGFALALVTISLGPLLAVTSTEHHFERNNPELLRRLGNPVRGAGG